MERKFDKTNVVMPTDDILFKLPILIIPSHLQNKVKQLHCQQNIYEYNSKQQNISIKEQIMNVFTYWILLKSDQSCICVLVVSIWPLLKIFLLKFGTGTACQQNIYEYNGKQQNISIKEQISVP
jgi:hypothetical protein